MKKLRKIAFSLGAITLVATPILSTISCGDSTSKKENQQLKSFVTNEVKNYVASYSATDALKILTGSASTATGTLQELMPKALATTGTSIGIDGDAILTSTDHLVVGGKLGLYETSIDKVTGAISDHFVKYGEVFYKYSCMTKINDTHYVVGTSDMNGLFQVTVDSNGKIINMNRYPIGNTDYDVLPANITNAILVSQTKMVVTGNDEAGHILLYNVGLADEGYIVSTSKFTPSVFPTAIGSYVAKKAIFQSIKVEGITHQIIVARVYNSATSTPMIFTIGLENGIMNRDENTTDNFTKGLPQQIIKTSDDVAFATIDGVGAPIDYILVLKTSISEGEITTVNVGTNVSQAMIAKISDNLVLVGGSNNPIIIKIDSTTGLPLANNPIIQLKNGTDLGDFPKFGSTSFAYRIGTTSHVLFSSETGDLYDSLVNPFSSAVKVTAKTTGNEQSLTFQMSGYADETITWTKA